MPNSLSWEYGGNPCPGSNARNISWTKKLISRQIQAHPCRNPKRIFLFVGPADMAKKENGTMQTYPSLHQVIQEYGQSHSKTELLYGHAPRHGGDGFNHSMGHSESPTCPEGYIHFFPFRSSPHGNLLFRSLIKCTRLLPLPQSSSYYGSQT
jgi:hypothetical protein